MAPKQRVKEEARRLRRLELFQKNKVLFDRERAMRQLRDAKSQAEALEHYLATLNPAYRQAAEGRRKKSRNSSKARSEAGRAPRRCCVSTPPRMDDFARH